MNKINILAAGPKELWPKDIFVDQSPWIGVDQGGWYLLDAGKQPAFLLGDFDSFDNFQEEMLKNSQTKIIKVPAEKDFTDLELAINTIQENYNLNDLDMINVYGATGGRLDQLLNNLWVFGQEKYHNLLEKLRFIDKDNYLQYFVSKKMDCCVRRYQDFKYIGFMPMKKESSLNIKDAKYPLLSWQSDLPFMWSSNEFITDEIHFSFEDGPILVCQSKS